MDKKASILNAALVLFVENGFHGTATGKIAQEAGVASGTLFQYFKTKDELVVALYLHVKNELAEYVAQHIVQGAEIKASVRSLILASLFWALEHPLKFRFIQQIQTSPYLKQVDPNLLHQQVAPHISLIQKGVEGGIFKPLPADLLYALMSHQVFALFHYLTEKKYSKQMQKDTIQTTCDLIWDMLT